MRAFLLGVLLIFLPAESRLAGECAGMCNDLRLEVLTNEMCRYVLAGHVLSMFVNAWICQTGDSHINLISPFTFLSVAYTFDMCMYFNFIERPKGRFHDQKSENSAQMQWSKGSLMPALPCVLSRSP